MGRWHQHCGCSTGGRKNWTQYWRAPLREGLNILKQDLDEIFQEEGSHYFNDPWKARNNYIDVLWDQAPEVQRRFIEENCKALSHEDEKNMWSLLNMELNGMFMFTSCGWFFTDISGIETVQIMAYAAKAIEEASKFTSQKLEKNLLHFLEHAHSNIAKNKNGAYVYKKFVKPMNPNYVIQHKQKRKTHPNVENAAHQ